MNIKLIENKQELDKAITAWGKAGQKWAQQGHVLAMSALAHHAKHGDITLVNRVYTAMPKGTKSSAMAEWILAFGALKPNEDKEAAKTSPFVHDKTKACDLAGAAQTPWTEFKPEPTVLELFDVQKAVHAILNKAAKAASVSDSDMLGKLRALVGGEASEAMPEGEEAPL